VRHFRGDVEDDVDLGVGRAQGEPARVVEEHLVGADLDQQGRQAGQVGRHRRAEQRVAAVLADDVEAAHPVEGRPFEQGIRFRLGHHAHPGSRRVHARRERDDRRRHGEPGVARRERARDRQPAAGRVAG
jgi:hypothetical protein